MILVLNVIYMEDEYTKCLGRYCLTRC